MPPDHQQSRPCSAPSGQRHRPAQRSRDAVRFCFGVEPAAGDAVIHAEQRVATSRGHRLRRGPRRAPRPAHECRRNGATEHLAEGGRDIVRAPVLRAAQFDDPLAGEVVSEQAGGGAPHVGRADHRDLLLGFEKAWQHALGHRGRCDFAPALDEVTWPQEGRRGRCAVEMLLQAVERCDDPRAGPVLRPDRGQRDHLGNRA